MLLTIHLSLTVTNHSQSEDFLANTNLLTRYGIRGVGERACEDKRRSLPGSCSIWLERRELTAFRRALAQFWLERRVEARFAGLWLIMIGA